MAHGFDLTMISREYSGVKRAALSFSGGLDSFVAGVLLTRAGIEVIPVVLDMGQQSDLKRVKKNAESVFGKCIVMDVKGWVADSAIRAIKSNYGSDGRTGFGGISRPVIARALAIEAQKLGCDAIAHGSSGTGNDHIILENSLRVLAPEMRVLAPVRDFDLKRDWALEFAKKNRLPTNMVRALRYSSDENLAYRTVRQGEAANHSRPLPEDAYKWTVSPCKLRGKKERIEIGFSQGAPSHIKANGRKISGGAEIFSALNSIGGKHGIGRTDTLEDKLAGLKIREVHECPAFTILLAAHREMESLTLTRRELEAKKSTDALWAHRVRDGGWYTRLRRALDAFTDEISRPVEGNVTFELCNGSMGVVGRESNRALYDKLLSARDSKGVFPQKDTRAFAKLYGLQEVMGYLVESE